MTSAGIIAAGNGTRLQSAFPATPKSMIPIGGRPLVYWVVSSLRAAGIRSITLLHNSEGRPVRGFLKTQFQDIQWTFLEKNTRSSWESFRLVSVALSQMSRQYMISTVDALISVEDTLRFASEIANLKDFDAALALTRFVYDENPLWADCDTTGRITALGPLSHQHEFVTSGLYAMTRDLAQALPAPETYDRLRDFWITSVHEGRRVLGVPLSKTLDVDRPEDIAAAEKFVESMETHANQP